MTVDVAIVNYNTRDRLRDCLTALRAGDDHGDGHGDGDGDGGGDGDTSRIGTIFVADNGSTDGSLDMLAAEFPDVVAVSLPHNPGYGAAANVLIERSSAEVVVLLNADVEADPDSIGALADHLADHPGVAIAGPRIVHEDGSLQRSCFEAPTVGELLWQESAMHRWRRRRPATATFDHDADRSVPWVLGAILALRRSAMTEIGGFDPGFFLYYEEVDLADRARERGWDVHFTPAAEVTHRGGASTAQRSVTSQRTHYRSLARYHRIHGTASMTALRLAVVAIMAARLVRDAVASVAPGATAARQRCRAWRTVLAEAVRGWPVTDVPDVPNGASGDAASAPDGGVPPERLDWLALLPTLRSRRGSTARPTAAVLGSMGAPDRIALGELVEAAVITSDRAASSAPAGFDLVVRRADGDVGVAAALSMVAPDGVVVLESVRAGRSITQTSRRVARQASAAGFSVIGRHWVLPDATAPRRFVPLDAVGPLRWYLDGLFVPAGPAQRLARRVVRRVPALADLLAMSHVVVAVRGARRESALATFPAVAAAGVGADDALVVLSSGHDLGSRSVVLPFADADDRPRCVIKVSSRTAMNETTEREHETLTRLHDALPADLVDDVPRPLGLVSWNGRAVSVETAMNGPTLEAVLRRADGPADRIAVLDGVATWIIRLHGSTAEHVTWDEPTARHWLDEAFAVVGRAGDDRDGPVDAVHQVLERARRRGLDHVGCRLPIVRRHFDLGPWNVVRRDPGPGLGVIDWETSANRPADGRGLPFCDLDYFVKYWLHIVGGADTAVDELALFAHLPAPAGLTTDELVAARRVLRTYCAALDIPLGLAPVLSLAGWAEHVSNDAARSALLGRERDDASSARRFVGVLATTADALFDDPFPPPSG